ncbi:hypothetical protein [Subtercola vilae]|uniref:hypothetical protein n=1 Tax=Subtercola vilae TaxID=2056433 RepID=UPI001375CE92|nr:hypothetical protein [Subtercola vilae]
MERKAKFINQILRGKLDSREIEGIGDAALGAAEMKAITSGNLLLLEKAEADNDYQRLQRLERAHHRAQTVLAATRQQASSRIDNAENELYLLRQALPRTTDVSGDNFVMTVGNNRYTTRAEAGQALTEWAANSGAKWLSAYENRRLGTLGEIAGHTIDAGAAPGLNQQPFITLTLRDIPHSSIQLGRDSFLEGGAGLIRQLEHRATGIPRSIETVEQAKQEAQTAIREAEARLGQSFNTSTSSGTRKPGSTP